MLDKTSDVIIEEMFFNIDKAVLDIGMAVLELRGQVAKLRKSQKEGNQNG